MKPYDTGTGLYNYGYRDYSPQAARFTTVDPVRDGSNWYAYVNNDPVNWIDLWGLSASDANNGWTAILIDNKNEVILRNVYGYTVENGIMSVNSQGVIWNTWTLYYSTDYGKILEHYQATSGQLEASRYNNSSIIRMEDKETGGYNYYDTTNKTVISISPINSTQAEIAPVTDVETVKGGY